MKIDSALKNAFGFGGVNVSLCFKRYWYYYKYKIQSIIYARHFANWGVYNILLLNNTNSSFCNFLYYFYKFSINNKSSGLG